MRTKPAHQSAQGSQLLFGERVIIIDRAKEKWLKIRNHYDNYEGWVLKSHILSVPYYFYKKNLTFYVEDTKSRLLLENNKGILRLSPGSELFQMKRNQIHWPDFPEMMFKGHRLNRKKAVFTKESLNYWCGLFLGTPYLWGGKSIYGIDCSGFSQMVFKMLGYRLPRDAYQQAVQGETLHFLQEAKGGDLAFFDDNDGHINHVGILLNHKTIVHATETAGRVVVDTIDAEGIISRKLNKRTHSLRFVNRYFSE